MKNLLFSLILLCACSVSQSAKAQQLLEALEGEQSTKWTGLTYELVYICSTEMMYNGVQNEGTFQTQHSWFQCNTADNSQNPEGIVLGYNKHCDDVDTSVDIEKKMDILINFRFMSGQEDMVAIHKASNGYYLLVGINGMGNQKTYCIK